MNTKKIKILFRHRSMEMGGVEKVMLSLLNNLDKEKFDMTVLLSLNQGELRNEFPHHVRKIYLVDGKEDLSTNPVLQKIQLLQRKWKLEKFRKNPEKIDREILKNEFDVEIAMTYNDFEPVLNSSNKNSKKIGWFHSEIDLPKLQPLVPKILGHFPQFDHMVYCSEKIMQIMHRSYPNLKYPPESVIVNAVPVDEIRKKSEEKIPDFKDRPAFVSVGRLHTRKGFHKLMDAHHRLLKEGFGHSVVIIGHGEELPNLLAQQKQLGVENSFLFLGNKMNPYPYLKKADFFIMPSESEAWPLVLAEALILQKPSIATNTGDVSTMLDDGKTGILINYDEGEMYNAMKEFLTNEILVSETKENLKSIEGKFDNDLIFKSVKDLIISLYEQKN